MEHFERRAAYYVGVKTPYASKHHQGGRSFAHNLVGKVGFSKNVAARSDYAVKVGDATAAVGVDLAVTVYDH